MIEPTIIKEIRLAYTKPDPYNPEGKPWDYPAVCVVRSNCYGSQLSTFLDYLKIAQETYPTLSAEDIKVVQFGGIRYKGTFGIEFVAPENPTEVPKGWTQISELELLK